MLLITVIVMLWPSLVHSFIRYILMSNYIVRNCSIPTIISIGPWLPIPRNNNSNINNRFSIVLEIQQQTNWCNLNLIAQHSVLYYNPSHGVTPCGWLTEPPTQSIMKKTRINWPKNRMLIRFIGTKLAINYKYFCVALSSSSQNFRWLLCLLFLLWTFC